jgi:hypothetical protein
VLLLWVKLILSTCAFLSPCLSEVVNNGPSSLCVISAIYPNASVLHCIFGTTSSPVCMTWGSRLNSRSYMDPFQDLHELHHPLPTVHKSQHRVSWCDLTLDIAKPVTIWSQVFELMEFSIGHIQTYISLHCNHQVVIIPLDRLIKFLFMCFSYFLRNGFHLAKISLPLSSNISCFSSEMVFFSQM